MACHSHTQKFSPLCGSRFFFTSYQPFTLHLACCRGRKRASAADVSTGNSADASHGSSLWLCSYPHVGGAWAWELPSRCTRWTYIADVSVWNGLCSWRSAAHRGRLRGRQIQLCILGAAHFDTLWSLQAALTRKQRIRCSIHSRGRWKLPSKHARQAIIAALSIQTARSMCRASKRQLTRSAAVAIAHDVPSMGLRHSKTTSVSNHSCFFALRSVGSRSCSTTASLNCYYATSLANSVTRLGSKSIASLSCSTATSLSCSTATSLGCRTATSLSCIAADILSVRHATSASSITSGG